MTRDLATLPVLALDCQTTGATPSRGHLLEIGWCLTRAGEGLVPSGRVAHHLVRLPRGAVVPRSVQRLTGISPEAMRDAIPGERLWKRIASAARLSGPGSAPVPAVAHFARFERGFLARLHRECAPDAPFLLRFLCTHEIALRLFPDLPRRGLRALSGYLGFPLPEAKRAAAHVSATTGIWSRLVEILATDRGVRTLEDLARFLAEPPPPRSGAWSVPLLRATRLRLRSRPGVYRFLARDGSVLYVGKAKSLRNRVNSYYRRRRAEDKVLELVSQAWDVHATETPTLLEAALLENEEIKRLDPPYNTALRVRGRGVWFFRSDLESVRTTPDGRHRLGPVPAREPLRALLTLSGFLQGRAAAEPGLIEAFQIPRRSVEPGAVAAAVALFRERNGIPARGAGIGDLFTLGARLRERRLEAAAEAAGAAPRGGEEPDPKPPGRGAWSPEEIARHLESRVILASLLSRRARWLCLVAESTVVWSPAAGERGVRRALVLERGAVTGTGDLTRGAGPLFPPGEARTHAERRRQLDRAGYDRLHVLTIELRRVLHEGKEPEVVLGARRRLGPEQLGRLLRMI